MFLIAPHGLCCEGDNRKFFPFAPFAYFLHGCDAVHLGHHDIHQNEINLVLRILQSGFERSDCFKPVPRDPEFHAATFQHAREGENIPNIVFDHEDAAPLKGCVAIARFLYHPLLLGWEVGYDLMEE